MREFLLAANRITLNLAEGPQNGPLLVLLHGFTNRWQTFLPILPALIDRWHVVAFDHRGHGISGRVPGGYTAAGFYADAEAVLTRFGSEPAVLLGHSMGGSMALHLAQNHPERVRAVVAGDTSLNLSTHIDVMNSRRNTKLFGLRRKLAGRPVDELIRRGLPPEQAEEMSQLDPAVMDFHAEGRVQGFFADIQDVDFDKIGCPLLLTQASPEKGGLLQDVEIPPMLAAHPKFKYMRFDTGHDLEIEKGPESPFFKVALQFLSSVANDKPRTTVHRLWPNHP
jgi:pimeloyl-ACP methyl ester carboxylesterase